MKTDMRAYKCLWKYSQRKVFFPYRPKGLALDRSVVPVLRGRRQEQRAKRIAKAVRVFRFDFFSFDDLDV